MFIHLLVFSISYFNLFALRAYVLMFLQWIGWCTHTQVLFCCGYYCCYSKCKCGFCSFFFFFFYSSYNWNWYGKNMLVHCIIVWDTVGINRCGENETRNSFHKTLFTYAFHLFSLFFFLFRIIYNLKFKRMKMWNNGKVNWIDGTLNARRHIHSDESKREKKKKRMKEEHHKNKYRCTNTHT